MFGIILSFIIALFLIFNPIAKDFIPNTNFMAAAIIIVAVLFIFIHAISLAFAWGPLQRAEQNLTSRILEMFKKDVHFRWVNFWQVIFPLASFFIAIDLLFTNQIQKNIILAVWIFLLGISLDTLHHFFQRITSYLNPYSVVEMFAREAKESIQNDREMDLCDWIDALSEIAVKGVQRNGTSLCIQSMDSLQHITKNFLSSSKSISHPAQDKETKALGITDKVSFTLFYILQRLELINQKAIEKRLETICSAMITVMGKITIDAAKLDLTLTSYPLSFMDKFTKSGQEHHFPDVGVKETLTLLEVSKSIINEVDVTYADLKDPFTSIITHLEETAKNIFRDDKNINIKILTQPFFDLKELFNNPKVANHQDTPFILQSIDNVISQFQTLELLLRTIPPLPDVKEEPSMPVSSNEQRKEEKENQSPG